ncbi:hypothetical protein FRC14_005095 [Serendipita sp. 396]|nr:hypothetical protein FRC14_005095 [Serendipita sp. 396]KAG8797602.1 hypothetical protein FRC16_008717 [Serendipita sp. 398]
MSHGSSVSRRAVRERLNCALDLAKYAVQLDDMEDDHARSIEAYQKSVELLDQCIEMIKIRWNLTRWRQDEDVPGSIAQLETIRDNYKARITSLSFRANVAQKANAAQRARSL